MASLEAPFSSSLVSPLKISIHHYKITLISGNSIMEYCIFEIHIPYLKSYLSNFNWLSDLNEQSILAL